MITIDQLKEIIPFAGPKAGVFFDPLNDAMDEFSVSTPLERAAFLAQVGHESGSLCRMCENMNYSAPRLAAVFPRYFTPEQAIQYARQPSRIASRVYAGRGGNGNEASGDGWRFVARGCFGITFRSNYAACSKALFGDDRLLHSPELLEEPAAACRSAGWFWAVNGIGRFADAGDFDGVCDVVNRGRKTDRYGDAIAFVERLAFYERAKEVLSA